MATGERVPADPVLARADGVDLETLAWAVADGEEPDRRFYERLLRAAPGLALEAGCGTGRLLVALLRVGLPVEGCDISADMLAFCRLHAAAHGLAPALHLCSIQELPFADRYATILLACGTFMCVTDDVEVDRCLDTLRANLVPGGRLVVSLMPPTYLQHAGGPFPTPWEPYYELPMPGGRGTLVVDWRATALCPVRQVVDEECRYRWTEGGAIVREEVSTGRHRWYRRDQFLDRLRRAGFADVVVYANYTDQPSPDGFDSPLSFVATRPL